MLVLGLQGSPRKKGNTAYLLNLFMDEAEKLGAKTKIIEAAKLNIKPCMEYIVCEKKGTCPIDDEMEHEVLPLLRNADVIIPATPMFFYSCTAQLKALIDRTQVLWARRYKLKLTDPLRKWRKGFLIAVGATKGKNLFEGMNFTAKYFFDAVGASFDGSLTYRKIENAGDMEKHSTVRNDVKEAAEGLLKPLLSRKRILFVSSDDSCSSQMAKAFCQIAGSNKFEAESAGFNISENIDNNTLKVMEEIGIDMKYRYPKKVDSIIKDFRPNVIIQLCNTGRAVDYGDCVKIKWDTVSGKGVSIDEIRNIRDEIDKRIKDLIIEL